ncbi:MAG: helix-turn-helix domain-containing protein [Stenomitos frigidus ULC029]
MTSRKLSESDKQEMLQLYRQPGETTSTLASRYSVSNSTISRILKTSFSEAEYETLIQQKRGGRSATEIALPPPLDSEPIASVVNELLASEEPLATLGNVYEGDTVTSDVVSTSVTASLSPTVVDEPVPSLEATVADEPLATTNGRRLRKRSSAPSEPIPSVAPPTIRSKIPEQVDRSATSTLEDAVLNADPLESLPFDLASDDLAAVAAVVEDAALLDDADELAGALEDDDLGDDDLDDDLDDDDLEDDDLDDDLENGSLLLGSRIAGKMLVQVLPLAEASLPRTCYLVVDRSAELIARPLQEFGDLGQIPEAEVLSKTLPVFDNHRIAKRYSNPRTQRVIKLPDGQVLQKTSSHLQAKGITRLLIDGQVYAL